MIGAVRFPPPLTLDLLPSPACSCSPHSGRPRRGTRRSRSSPG